MATQQPKHILIAPLDWGLGHTTRCIPLIRHIQQLGHVPVVAGNQAQRTFIEETFGNIENIHLEGYNISYSGWNRFSQAGLLSQLPRIQKTITAEHKWLQQLSHEIKIDGIISDNRYGLFHDTIPSVIITHQLNVLSGLGNITDRAILKIHYSYLNRFQNTWVADAPGEKNLGGKLSHPAVLPRHTKYIGLLSQFEEVNSNIDPDHYILILLSGPEPQRSILSRILWQQAIEHKGKVVFIEGSTQVTPPAQIPSHIQYFNRVTAKTLLPLLQNAGIVICRSGYSTLMDLAALNKKAILIPTPGQTEQEYLAKTLNDKGIYYVTKQNGFNLETALNEAQHFPYHSLPLQQCYGMYKPVLEDWVEKL